jgi:hypothetical protein
MNKKMVKKSKFKIQNQKKTFPELVEAKAEKGKLRFKNLNIGFF